MSNSRTYYDGFDFDDLYWVAVNWIIPDVIFGTDKWGFSFVTIKSKRGARALFRVATEEGYSNVADLVAVDYDLDI